MVSQTSGAFPKAAAKRIGHVVQERRRALARDQRRWTRDRFRARLRHLETRRQLETATPITLNIDAETQENLSEVQSFNSQADDYDLAPSSRRIAFSIHGEIFTAPVEEGDLKQVTDGPARDRNVSYSPDGKWLSYVSDQSGREEIYVVPVDGSAPAQQITDIDALKLGYNWSPDSKEIAFASSDDKLRKLTVATKQVTELDSSRYGGFGTPVWSPDGKWIAYSKPDISRTSDIYVIAASGAGERTTQGDL